MLDKIFELPVIIQGALGSALFAFGMWFINKIFKSIIGYTNKLRDVNTTASKVVTMATNTAEPNIISMTLLNIVYLTIPLMIKAVICICVGSIFSKYFPLIHEISIIFSLYYLYQALVHYIPINSSK